MTGRDERTCQRAHAHGARARCPEARSEAFWYAARREIDGERAIDPTPLGPFEPPIDEPPERASEPGAPFGLPGERGFEDDLAELRPVRGQRLDG